MCVFEREREREREAFIKFISLLSGKMTVLVGESDSGVRIIFDFFFLQIGTKRNETERNQPGSLKTGKPDGPVPEIWVTINWKNNSRNTGKLENQKTETKVLAYQKTGIPRNRKNSERSFSFFPEVSFFWCQSHKTFSPPTTPRKNKLECLSLKNFFGLV